MKRLKHFFGGHRWIIVSATFVPPKGSQWEAVNWDFKMAHYEFTTILERCECGAKRDDTILGDHSGVKSSAELADLERMIK